MISIVLAKYEFIIKFTLNKLLDIIGHSLIEIVIMLLCLKRLISKFKIHN